MNLIKDLLAGGLKGLGDAAKSVIDSINAPKEEKEKARVALELELNRHAEALIAQANDLEKSYLADVQNARETNVKIQESDKASWLAKNVGYVMDVFVMLLWGSLTTYLMVVMLHLVPKQAGVDYTAVTAVWGAVSATFATILNWHRGSSQGSADKQKMIDKLVK